MYAVFSYFEAVAEHAFFVRPDEIFTFVISIVCAVLQEAFVAS